MKKYFVFVSLVFLFCSSETIYANLVITDTEYDKIISQLKRDKSIIDENTIRWTKLKTTKPEITYDIEENGIVIQKISVPIYKSNPLTYDVKMKIDLNKPKEKFFPLNVLLCAMFEMIPGKQVSVNSFDILLGLKIFHLAPLNKYATIGFNVLIGIRSAGLSLSYTFPKPLGNTSLHGYVGINYSGVATYGIGLSLNF